MNTTTWSSDGPAGEAAVTEMAVAINGAKDGAGGEAGDGEPGFEGGDGAGLL